MRGQQALARPVANQACESVQVVVESTLQRRRKQIRALDNATDLSTLAIQSRQIGRVSKISGQRLNCGPWRFRQVRILLYLRPTRENFAAFLHSNAVSYVVAQHHVETRQQYLLQ